MQMMDEYMHVLGNDEVQNATVYPPKSEVAGREACPWRHRHNHCQALRRQHSGQPRLRQPHHVLLNQRLQAGKAAGGIILTACDCC